MLKKIILKYWNSPTFVTWFSFFTKSLNLVLIIPLLLKKIEPSEVSLWYIFLSIVNLLSTIDAGFGSTFSRAVAYANTEQKDQDDIDYLATLNFVIKKYFLIIGLIVFGLVCIYIAWCIFFSKLLIPIYFIALLLSPIIAFGNYYVCILTGLNKIVILRRWESLTNILITFSNLIILIIYPNVYWLIIIFQIWSLFNIIKNYLLVKKYFNFTEYEGHYNNQIANNIKNQFLKEAIKSVIGVISSLGLFYMVSIYYSIYFVENKNLLASYLFCFSIIQSVRSFSQAPFYSKLPTLNNLYALGKTKEFIEISQKGIYYSILSFIIPILCIIFFGEKIFALIHSKVAFPPIKLWILLGSGFLIERIGAMYLQVYSTSNHIVWDKLNFGTAVIILLYMYIFLNSNQIYTFPIALVIGYAFFYTPISYYLSRKMIRSLNYKNNE